MWAAELWPYVNGKALMSGVDILEPEASQAMDVIHFLMEEDNAPTQEIRLARSNARTNIYEALYERPYKYQIIPEPAKDYSKAADDMDSGALWGQDVDAFGRDAVLDPRNPPPVKPYFPPTDFDPDADEPFPGLGPVLG